MKNSEKYSIVPSFIRDKFREYRKTKEDQESSKSDEKREKENAMMEKNEYAKGGMVKGYAKGGMVSPRGVGKARNKPCKVY